MANGKCIFLQLLILFLVINTPNSLKIHPQNKISRLINKLYPILLLVDDDSDQSRSKLSSTGNNIEVIYLDDNNQQNSNDIHRHDNENFANRNILYSEDDMTIKNNRESKYNDFNNIYSYSTNEDYRTNTFKRLEIGSRESKNRYSNVNKNLNSFKNNEDYVHMDKQAAINYLVDIQIIGNGRNQLNLDLQYALRSNCEAVIECENRCPPRKKEYCQKSCKAVFDYLNRCYPKKRQTGSYCKRRPKYGKTFPPSFGNYDKYCD